MTAIEKRSLEGVPDGIPTADQSHRAASAAPNWSALAGAVLSDACALVRAKARDTKWQRDNTQEWAETLEWFTVRDEYAEDLFSLDTICTLFQPMGFSLSADWFRQRITGLLDEAERLGPLSPGERGKPKPAHRTGRKL